MRKIIVALLVVLGLGAGAYFGAITWAERTAAREVDARLDRWRSGGGVATRGRVAFDLWTRTLKVADVALQSPLSADEHIAIAEVIATGVDMSGGARRLELVGLQTSHALPGLGGALLQQTAPRVTLTDYSERPRARTGGASPLDAVRRWLGQLSAIAASSIEVPSLIVKIAPAGSGSRPSSMGPTEHTYSNVVLRNVAEGRIAEVTFGSVAMRGSAGGMSPGFTGEMTNVSVRDIDVGPALAWLNPSGPREEGYQRIYGQLVTGPYTVRFDDGTGMAVDRILAEDIGLRPAKLSLDDLVFLIEVRSPGTTPTTIEQMSRLVDKMAGLYEGVHLGKLDIQGLRVDTLLGGGLTIGSIALNGLDNGRLAEMSIERLEDRKTAKETAKETGALGRMTGVEKLEGRTAGGHPDALVVARRDPINVGRLSVKGFAVANLLRIASTQLASLDVRPSGPSVGPNAGPDGMPSPVVAMLGVLEGVELRDFAAPDPATGRTIRIEAFDTSWGRPPVGGIPSEARLSARLSVPINPADPDVFIRALAERGMADLAISLDVGAHWKEGEQSVILTP